MENKPKFSLIKWGALDFARIGPFLGPLFRLQDYFLLSHKPQRIFAAKRFFLPNFLQFNFALRVQFFLACAALVRTIFCLHCQNRAFGMIFSHFASINIAGTCPHLIGFGPLYVAMFQNKKRKWHAEQQPCCLLP